MPDLRSGDWTSHDTNDLLTVIAAYDGRAISPEDITAWTQLARLGRWRMDLAGKAVADHFLTSTERLKPAHIHERVRSMKNEEIDRAARERDAAEQGKKPRPVAELLAGLAERWSVPEDDDDGAAAAELGRITAPCPHCRAPAGSPCTRHGRDGAQIVAPHPSRHDALAELADGLADVDSPVRCPECHAPPGRRCVNTRTGSYISFRLGTHHKRMVAEHDDDGGRGEPSNADQIRMQAHGEWKAPAGGDG